jgi:hypothetical protein
MIKAGASHSVYFSLFCPIRPDTAIRLAPTHTVRVCRHGAGSFLPCWWKSEAPSSCQRMIHAWNGLVRHILCLPTHVCRLILTGRDCRRNRQKLFDVGTRQEHVVASALSNPLRTSHLLARKRPRWMPDWPCQRCHAFFVCFLPWPSCHLAIWEGRKQGILRVEDWCTWAREHI